MNSRLMTRLSLVRALTCEAFTPVVIALLLFVGGCQATASKKPASQPTAAPVSLTLTIKQIGDGDPQPAPSMMVRLVIFMIDMPSGSVSDNTEFWKRVDELSAGPGQHDRLLRNGIRCGVVPESESLFFSQFFSHRPLAVSHVEGVHSETFELQMEKHFDRQDLFFFNLSDELEGRSYDHGTDQLSLSFGPAPRRGDAVRLSLCPVVRSEKTRMEFTPMNDEFQSPMNDVDRIYDLGMTADVPEGSFFIISPSTDARRITSIGGSFLTRAEKTERVEQVIVIVPSFLRMDGKPIIVRDPIIK